MPELIKPLLTLRSLLVLIIPVMLVGFHYRYRLSTRGQAVWLGLVAAIILGYGGKVMRVIIQNVTHPPEWDFLCFWLWGKIAVQGLNFYEPAAARQIALPFQPTSEFTQEIIDIGFWYPPPSIFLFAPLGWFDTHTAYLLWSIVHAAILVGSAVLLWQLFLEKHWTGGLLALAMVLMLSGTLGIFVTGQSNALALLMLLLFWRDRTRPIGGAWLALAMLTKPFLALLLVYLALRRYWRTLVGAILTLGAASLLTIGVFGLTTFFSYFKPDRYIKLPHLVFTDPSNQSLLSNIIRLTQYDFSNASPLHHPTFIVLALILSAITFWLVFRLNQTCDDLALVLTLLLAILIYPSSMWHYTVLLIVPILLLWMHRQGFAYGVWITAALITVGYLLMSYNTFITTFLSWLICAGTGGWFLMQRSLPSVAEPS